MFDDKELTNEAFVNVITGALEDVVFRLDQVDSTDPLVLGAVKEALYKVEFRITQHLFRRQSSVKIGDYAPEVTSEART